MCLAKEGHFTYEPATNSNGRPRVNRSAVMTMAAVVALIVSATGCSNQGKIAFYAPEVGGLQALHVSSSAFESEGAIPKEYTADGRDVSPPLKWTAGPDQTQQFVIIVEDPDAKAEMPPVHWLVYGLPGSARALPAGASSATDQRTAAGVPFTEGKNYKSLNSYVGPEPAPGDKPHHYAFQIFALDQNFTLPPG